jgi:hypothetical protein
MPRRIAAPHRRTIHSHDVIRVHENWNRVVSRSDDVITFVSSSCSVSDSAARCRHARRMDPIQSGAIFALRPSPMPRYASPAPRLIPQLSPAAASAPPSSPAFVARASHRLLTHCSPMLSSAMMILRPTALTAVPFAGWTLPSPTDRRQPLAVAPPPVASAALPSPPWTPSVPLSPPISGSASTPSEPPPARVETVTHAAAAASKSSAASEANVLVLRDWFVRLRMTNPGGSPTVHLGYPYPPSDKVWVSSAVVARVDSRRLRTASGKIYVLDGDANQDSMKGERGWVSGLCRLFAKGFPEKYVSLPTRRTPCACALLTWPDMQLGVHHRHHVRPERSSRRFIPSLTCSEFSRRLSNLHCRCRRRPFIDPSDAVPNIARHEPSVLGVVFVDRCASTNGYGIVN